MRPVKNQPASQKLRKKPAAGIPRAGMRSRRLAGLQSGISREIFSAAKGPRSGDWHGVGELGAAQ
ncbi:MAG: hypothetical protein B9S36_04765 [Verrucomicrobiia bacterium Tous-C2TDCM]|nr:MAG: hypothetical protein B9S36_04765 [Verrucomicrobiae bacterium Tous-C2TDCM]